jgi:hypothetical protein
MLPAIEAPMAAPCPRNTTSATEETVPGVARQQSITVSRLVVRRYASRGMRLNSGHGVMTTTSDER